jgi:hypothetical protein
VALDLDGDRGVRPNGELRIDCGCDLIGDHARKCHARIEKPEVAWMHHMHRAAPQQLDHLGGSIIDWHRRRKVELGKRPANLVDEEIGATGPRAMSPIAHASACAILLWVSMRSPRDGQITDVLWCIAPPPLWVGDRFSGAD